MARNNSSILGGDGALRSADVPDETVSQVGKAVSEIIKLRQSLEENMATAQSEDERQSLANQAETAAVRAISDQGLTIDEYNEVITSAQADPDLEERVLTAYRAV